jgi:lysozyme
MKTGKEGINLIKKWEGCILTAYKCSAGKWTIGYGNTFYENNAKVKEGDKITKERAESLLSNLLPKFEDVVNKKVSVPLHQNQFDALVSYTWNTGGSDTLFNMINSKANDKDIRKWFETKYITANGKRIEGLVNRRKDEANLYFSK